MTIKALSPQFQLLLEQGQALEERVISGLDEGSKDALRFELRSWSNSVMSSTRDIRPHYGTEPLATIFEYADFFVVGLRPGDATNQIRQAIEIIASIPPKEPAPQAEISVSMDLQKLIGLGRAAQRPARKPWAHFVERLNEFKKAQALTFSRDQSRDVSGLVEKFLGELETDEASTHGLTQNFAEDYEDLKATVEGRITSIAWVVSGVTFLVPSILIFIGAIGVLIAHPFHAGVLDTIVGGGIIAFIVMEFLGVFNHLTHYRAKLESVIRRRLRRFFGTEKPPDESSFLGL